METRADALQWMTSVRSHRELAVALSSKGQISLVLCGHPAEFAHEVYVVKLLDVHPRLGKVAGRRLLNELGISHFARVADLSSEQVRAILIACGESHE